MGYRPLSTAKLGMLGALGLGLAGCASGPCTGNPLSDNVSCVQSGISSGQYQRRVDERQAEAVEKTRQVEAAKAANQLNQQIAAGKLSPGETSLQQAQLDYLRQRQATLARQQQAANNRELQEKAAALQRDIDALNAVLARR